MLIQEMGNRLRAGCGLSLAMLGLLHGAAIPETVSGSSSSRAGVCFELRDSHSPAQCGD